MCSDSDANIDTIVGDMKDIVPIASSYLYRKAWQTYQQLGGSLWKEQESDFWHSLLLKMILELFSLLLIVLWIWNRQETSRAREMIEKFPGPKDFPIIGFIRTIRSTTVDVLKRTLENNKLYAKGGSPFRILRGSNAFVILSHPKDFEIILSSQEYIEKSCVYKFILPWLGTGLLTSTGSKWRIHRKILTPAFHFKILEDFLDTFKSNAKVLVEKLQTEVNGPAFDVYKYITLYTLDNICETAMGVKINAQIESDSAYVRAIRSESTIVIQRSVAKPWLGLDFLFNMTKMKSIHEKSLKVLHNTSRKVIKARRATLEKQPNQDVQKETDSGIGIKKRLAFLDILVEAALEDPALTDEDIRQEVDTFMFAGHDTTSAAISFTLWLLSWHQDVQDKVFRELTEAFPDPNDPVKMRDMKNLKYLENVIKETLRLYPSVPAVSRRVNEDVTLSGGLVVPAGTHVSISIISSHINPEFWPDPFKFDPERFTPENIRGRHPYAYIPFSAGPRNCIGQKFAMLQIKLTVCEVLRAFKILPSGDRPNLQLANELVLVSANGVPVKLEQRD